MNQNVTPGIHPAVRDKLISYPKEEDIVRYWGREWHITAFDSISISGSSYRYCLIKPTRNYEEEFGLSKELIIVFSAYSEFQPRTLDAYERIFSRYGNGNNRIERICYVLISGDSEIEDKLSQFLSKQESQIVIPFTYEVFSENKGNDYFLRNSFRKFFYKADLFDVREPLTKDFYFFGRDQLTLNIIQKHKKRELCGLFGLRKTGKTSIIYDVIRKAPQQDSVGIFIDCQTPDFNKRRWNKALFYVVNTAYAQAAPELPHPKESDFTETDAGGLFKKTILTLSGKISKSVLLLFDEVENITFLRSSEAHWRDGGDFVNFWRSIRSAYQSMENKWGNGNVFFTFGVFGTNPECAESPSVPIMQPGNDTPLSVDNPIFSLVPFDYIPGFDILQTREMVRKLGKLMGITLGEDVYSLLNGDYGGHPFLMRQVCSAIAKCKPNRPVKIDRIIYTKVNEQFNQNSPYFEMVLDVLSHVYPDEYAMLKCLAESDIETFKYYAREDSSMVEHLKGYGIVEGPNCDEDYDFKIDSIKAYMRRHHPSLPTPQTADEKWAAIGRRRNAIETDLRKMVAKVLLHAYKTEADAKQAIINKIFTGRYYSHSYADLFNPKKVEIYLLQLKTLINANWDSFRDYWRKQEYLNLAIEALNDVRSDAHAKPVTDTEMNQMNAAADTIQEGIDKYKEMSRAFDF